MITLYKKYIMMRLYILLFIPVIAVHAMDAPVLSFYNALSDIIEARIAKNQNLNAQMCFLNDGIGLRFIEPLNNDPIVGETPLYASVGNDQYLPLTKRLLRNGADPNFSPSHWSRIPLFRAINYRAVKTVHTLLRAGANPLITVHGDHKLTLLHYICENVRVSNRPQLQESKKIVRLLLKYGADPNKQSARIVDRNPLYELCFTNKKTRPIMILLLKYGADISLLDANGKNLIAAAQYSIDRYGAPRYDDGLTFLKDWADGKIKLKKKKIR